MQDFEKDSRGCVVWRGVKLAVGAMLAVCAVMAAWVVLVLLLTAGFALQFVPALVLGIGVLVLGVVLAWRTVFR